MLLTDPSDGGEFPHLDTVSAISEALRFRYGDAALSIAKIQQATATEESLARWAEIVVRLRG